MDKKTPPPPVVSLSPTRVRWRRVISKACASPLGSAIFATSSVVGASIISVCSSIILGQIGEFFKGSDTQGHWTTVVAFLFSVFAIIILWFRERGISDMTNDREAGLRQQQNLMEGRLVSMPPKDFIYEYIIALRRAGELRMQSKYELKCGRLSAEQVRERIRSILSTVVVLTRLWDGVSRIRDNVVYKASVMNVVIPEELWDAPSTDRSNVQEDEHANETAASINSDEPNLQLIGRSNVASTSPDPDTEGTPAAADPDRSLFKPRQEDSHPYVFNTNSQRPAANDNEEEESWDAWVLGSPFFLHRQSSDVVWGRCTGAVAIVDTQLCVASCKKEPGDPAYDELQPIVLPYTAIKNYKVGHHHPNLPGAPMAAATGQPGYIENLSETIKNWLKKEQEVNPEITQKYLSGIDEYYKGLGEVSSLISIPISINDKLNAVLNIQKNNESLLYSHERADMFIHLMNPICYHLGRMLLLMYTVDAKTVRPEGDVDEPSHSGKNGTEG
jgi:hypothetical protein